MTPWYLRGLYMSDAKLGKPMDYAGFVKETGWELLQRMQVSGTAAQ